jgi:hypothetical protein
MEGSAMSELPAGHLADIAGKIRDQQCVLFLGAGAHAAGDGLDTQWPTEQRPPMGTALARYLATRSNFCARHPDDDPRNLMRVALDYEIERKRSGLIEAVRAQVQTGKTGSPLLEQLARLDFPVVVTTNFDTHFEDALSRVGKRPFVSTYKSNVDATERSDDYPRMQPSSREPFVLKLHGDIERSPGSIVITEEDYIQFVLRMSDKPPYHPVPPVAAHYLAKAATLFVGYGLKDYNLRLLFKTLRWRMDVVPQTYSVDVHPDPLVQEVLERRTGQVSYVVQDAWQFVPMLVAATVATETV